MLVPASIRSGFDLGCLATPKTAGLSIKVTLPCKAYTTRGQKMQMLK